jgi:hypothetical protein
MTRDDAVALQRRRVGSAYIPFPVLSGAVFRVFGLATFTIVDLGAGTLHAIVENNFAHQIRAGFTWSWGGTTSLTQHLLDAFTSAILETHIPPGFDAPLEIIVNDAP